LRIKSPSKFLWGKEKLSLYDGMDYFLSQIREPFSFSWAKGLLVENCQIYNPTPEDHIKQLLNQTEFLGRVALPDSIYYPSCLLFENTHFSIYPTEKEKKEGILVLSDALKPYHSPYLTFENLSFQESKGESIKTIHWPCKYENLEEWFLNLMEIDEPLFNNLVSDLKLVEKNFARMDEAEIHIPVLKLENFYSKHHFQQGDAVIFTLLDYHAGVFEISFHSSSPRSYYRFQSIEYQKELEQDVLEEILHSGCHPTIYRGYIDACARFKHQGRYKNFIPLAWSKYLKKTKKLKIFSFNHDRILYEGKLDKNLQLEMIQELCWVHHKCENLNDLLEFYSSSLNEEIIQAFIYQALKKGNTDEKGFYANLFQKYPLTPKDPQEQDKILFHFFCHQFWEVCQESYFEYHTNPQLSRFLEDALWLFDGIIHRFLDYTAMAKNVSIDHLKFLQNIRLGCDFVIKRFLDPDLDDQEIENLELLLKKLIRDFIQLQETR